MQGVTIKSVFLSVCLSVYVQYVITEGTGRGRHNSDHLQQTLILSSIPSSCLFWCLFSFPGASKQAKQPLSLHLVMTQNNTYNINHTSKQKNYNCQPFAGPDKEKVHARKLMGLVPHKTIRIITSSRVIKGMKLTFPSLLVTALLSCQSSQSSYS